MKIIKKILTKNDCYLKGEKINVKGVMIHSVGCPQPSSKVFIENWNKPALQQKGRKVCVHGFVECENIVYQTLPWNHRAWHCGGGGNNTHIGIEMTEPKSIQYVKGGNWTDLDSVKTKKHVLETYETMVELCTFLCSQFKLDPLGKGVVVSHKEGNKLKIASAHADPEHIWSKFDITMDMFRKDVADMMSRKNNESITLNSSRKDLNINISKEANEMKEVVSHKVKMERKLDANQIKVKDKVNVKKAIDYNNRSFKVFYPSYDVIQIDGDRIVIGIGSVITAAVNIDNIVMQHFNKMDRQSDY